MIFDLHFGVFGPGWLKNERKTSISNFYAKRRPLRDFALQIARFEAFIPEGMLICAPGCNFYDF